MKIVFIELCRAKETWRLLPTPAREQFLSEVEPLMDRLRQGGVEIVSWGPNINVTPERADYDFFGIFKFPDEASALRYERTFQQAGWYEYFEQVNVMGMDSTPNAILRKLVNL